MMIGLTDSKLKEAKPDRILDVLGFMCPEPVFRTRIEIGNMTKGQILEVLADDPASDDDIKSWVKKSGNQLILAEKKGNNFRFLIRKVK